MKMSMLAYLDVILDTRLGTLGKMGETIQSLALKAPGDGYFKRMIDDWDRTCGVGTTVAYQDLYRNRDQDTCDQAVLTSMILEFNKQSLMMTNALISDPLIDEVEIVVNTWPYIVTKEQEKNICDSLLFHMEEKVPMRCVHISLEDLTLAEIRDNWSAVILYDFVEWLTYRAPEIESGRNRCPRNSVVAPLLFTGKVPTRQELMVDGVPRDPFEATTIGLREFIKIEFWPIHHFCMIR